MSTALLPFAEPLAPEGVAANGVRCGDRVRLADGTEARVLAIASDAGTPKSIKIKTGDGAIRWEKPARIVARLEPTA